MAKDSGKQERIKALVAELLAEEAAEDGVDLERENIDDVENSMVRLGDLMPVRSGCKCWPATRAKSTSILRVPSAVG